MIILDQGNNFKRLQKLKFLFSLIGKRKMSENLEIAKVNLM